MTNRFRRESLSRRNAAANLVDNRCSFPARLTAWSVATTGWLAEQPAARHHWSTISRDNVRLIEYYLSLPVVPNLSNWFMNRLPRYAIILALSLGYAGLGVAAHAQTRATAKVPASTVSGRITVHGKGTAGIAVGIRSAEFSPQPRPSLKGTSDQDGYYRIVDVPPGNYVVTPLAPAYVSLDQSSARGRGTSLLLAAGENVDGIAFSLERGGVITGKVTALTDSRRGNASHDRAGRSDEPAGAEGSAAPGPKLVSNR